MWRAACVVTSLAVLTGCGSAIEGTRQYLNTAPPAPPQFSGTLDFDLLDHVVVGQGCADYESSITRSVMVVGSPIGQNGGLLAQAEAAAVFDALSKVKDAETMIITRSFTTGDTLKKLCTTVHGRAVRLKKGPTFTSSTQGHPVAPSPQPEARPTLQPAGAD